MTERAIFIGSGIVLILGGLFALFVPFAASLAATLIVGWTFILAGILHVVEAFRKSEHRLWNAGFGVVGVLLGLSFVLNPAGGMLSLTLVLAALFGASGALQLYLAWKRRHRDSVWMLGLSGVVSLALFALIAFNVFEAAAVIPGLVLAIELITTGLALVMLRPDARKAATGTTTDGRQA